METREPDSGTVAMMPSCPNALKTPLSSPIREAEISSQLDGRVIEPSEPRDDTFGLVDGRSRRRKYASRADQQKAYRARKAALVY